MSLALKLNDRTARAAVIGLSYVGLPQAMALAGAGFHVIGLDIPVIVAKSRKFIDARNAV